MTMTDPTRDTRDITRDTDLSDADLRMLARADWHESGGTLTGKVLAERYGKSPRWGQDQAAAARAETESRGTPKPAAATRPRQTTPPPAAKPTAPRAATKASARGKTPLGSLAGMRAVVAVVAGVAAVLSYSHIVELAIAAGAGWRAYILPLSLDGLVAACTYTLIAGGKGRWLAWAGIAAGLVGSVAANVIAVRPDLVDLEIVAAVLAGFPPVALAVSAHLLVRTAAAR